MSADTSGTPPGSAEEGATGGSSGPHLPRLLTIMGSGETAPTMAKVHRSVVERLASAPGRGYDGGTPGPDRTTVSGLLLDTPFGFQTNAEEIAARAVSYFRESVGADLEPAGMRSAADLTGPVGDRIISKMAELAFIFAGPGSPSYALRQWRGTVIPSLLAEKMIGGGAITFASAAALTLGVATVPVYEIYKVGEDPHWLEGLDLLSSLGLPVVFIPHYDNAEGQTHDTRFCYLGEERLSRMEDLLEPGTFVLGVDEHTALCIDLDDRTFSVIGRGGITVRVHGSSQRIEAGGRHALTELLELAEVLASELPSRTSSATSDRTGADAAEGASGLLTAVSRGSSGRPSRGDQRAGGGNGSAVVRPPGAQLSPLLQAIRDHESEFRSALAASDAPRMVQVVLALEEELWAWRADTLQSDEMDRGRASLRSMISELGRLSEIGTRDPVEVVKPYVEVALYVRDAARHERRFEEADAVRERLEALGIAVHDTPEGSSWELIGGRELN